MKAHPIFFEKGYGIPNSTLVVKTWIQRLKASPIDGVTPIDLSYAKNEEAGLQGAKCAWTLPNAMCAPSISPA